MLHQVRDITGTSLLFSDYGLAFLTYSVFFNHLSGIWLNVFLILFKLILYNYSVSSLMIAVSKVQIIN